MYKITFVQFPSIEGNVVEGKTTPTAATNEARTKAGTTTTKFGCELIIYYLVFSLKL